MPIDKTVPDHAQESDETSHPDPRSYIPAYVDHLNESGAINEPMVEKAFRRVPRHLFVQRFYVGDEKRGWAQVEHDSTREQAERLETI